MKAAKVQIKIHTEKRKKLHLVTFFLIVLAALIFFPAKMIYDKKASSENSRPPPGPLPVPEPASPSLIEYNETLRPRTTIGEVLSDYGFSPSEIQTLYDQTKPVYDLRRVKAGQPLRVYAGPDGKIVRLEYDLDGINYLSIIRNDHGFEAALKAHPVETRIGMTGGTIEDSPILAFNQLGEEDILTLAFAELFAWDVDFYIDIRRGDTFKVIFEKKYMQGEFAGYGNILAAELTNQGRVLQAFFYTPPDTQKPEYYDAEGKSLRKEFIKSPIKYARITSRFNRSRLHPIHKVYQAHYGVDYAAPVGTPAQATADGTVTFAGWNDASGRMVRIRHMNAYETMYLHLRSFGPRIRVGARVNSGDIVGYVGSSGESTGPHLDYRIKLRGSYINPLSYRFKPVEPLKQEFLEDYNREIKKYQILLEDPLVLVSPSLL
jgi:murein DD-endopeptidase MepM/ murein hydrolase activator NlpD